MASDSGRNSEESCTLIKWPGGSSGKWSPLRFCNTSHIEENQSTWATSGLNQNAGVTNFSAPASETVDNAELWTDLAGNLNVGTYDRTAFPSAPAIEDAVQTPAFDADAPYLQGQLFWDGLQYSTTWPQSNELSWGSQLQSPPALAESPWMSFGGPQLDYSAALNTGNDFLGGTGPELGIAPMTNVTPTIKNAVPISRAAGTTRAASHRREKLRTACPLCNKTFGRVPDLDRHLKSHLDSKRKCELCDREKRVSRPDKYKDHLMQAHKLDKEEATALTRRWGEIAAQ